MNKFKYISSITDDDLEKNIVIPCIDEEGFSCIIIKNSINKTILNTYSTDNLEVKLNRLLEKDNNNYYVHVIKAKKIDIHSKKQFETIYEYIFKKFNEPISDVELAKLITSLEDYFKTTPEKDLTTFQIGVYGELFTLKYLYEKGCKNILNKYHKNFYSKHDMELDEHNRLEIKTVAGDRRIHTFKHNQICRDDINVYVVSVMLECVKNGYSLYDLFEEIKSICIDPDMIFELDKLMIKSGVNEDVEGIKCSLDLAKENIRFIDVNNLPHLDKYTAKVDGISNIQYDVDCELAGYIEIEDFVSIINNL